MVCALGHTDVVKLLLDLPVGRIDYNVRDSDGRTGFTNACEHGPTRHT